MKRSLSFVAGFAALAACDLVPSEPAVVAFNESTVTIRGLGNIHGLPPGAGVPEMASEMCGTVDREARYLSSTRVGQYQTDWLFLCE
jgi:hypothetical protein